MCRLSSRRWTVILSAPAAFQIPAAATTPGSPVPRLPQRCHMINVDAQTKFVAHAPTAFLFQGGRRPPPRVAAGFLRLRDFFWRAITKRARIALLFGHYKGISCPCFAASQKGPTGGTV